MEVKEVQNEELHPMEFKRCMRQVIGELREEKKFPAMRTHISTLNSFTKFMDSREEVGKIILFDEAFTPGRLKVYQEWLLRRNASWDTVSTYMRRLQVTYNRMIPPGSEGSRPKLFADVYTKVAAQTKRALKEEQMGRLVQTDLDSLPEELRPALAYFLLMFLFRGMPFIDLAYLRKRDVRGDCIVYCRHKTGKQLMVRIPKEAEVLFRKYKDKNPNSPYLLPDTKLSSYTARHTWATLAFYMGTPVGVICKVLGHSSIRITETYLKPFENEKVDEANKNLITTVARESLMVNSAVIYSHL